MVRRVPFSLVVSLISVIASCFGQTRDFVPAPETYGLYNDILQDISLVENLADLSVGIVNFFQESRKYQSKEPPDMTPRHLSEYDFIVVGAGSAGAAVASRLSEVEDVTVLLIEAGRSESLIMDVPILVNYLQLSNDINWKYQTEPSDRYCLGMTNNRCNLPRGKVMGGSSVLNYMIATRGNPRDYDRWAEMGNDGWSYKDILPYFKKLENLHIPKLKRDTRQHSTNGPLHIGYPPYRTPLAESFMQAGQEMGYNKVDYNGRDEKGFSYLQTTIANGTRMSSSMAYLHPAKIRKNLFVTKQSLASKVLIDPKTKRAVGLEFKKDGKNIMVRARKEVILSAGAIGTPQLLMLSGIGPAEHLKDLGIRTIIDAPVGQNLMDHIAYGGLVFLVDQPVGIVTRDMANPIKPYLRDFLTRRTGPFTIPGGCEALAFINVDDDSYNRDRDYPNVELLFTSGSVVSDPVIRYSTGLSDQFWDNTYASVAGRYSWTILPMLMRPKSRGHVLLRDGNIESKPRIVANYMDHPEDVKIMIEGIKAAVNVSRTRAMQKFGSRLHDIPLWGCENHEYDSELYWECAARTFTFTIYHYSGTCKMGPADDPTAVVNSRLQVIGVDGLRVADASIMPEIPTGHTHIPSIMIAEKLADMIKEDWGYPTEPLR